MGFPFYFGSLLSPAKQRSDTLWKMSVGENTNSNACRTSFISACRITGIYLSYKKDLNFLGSDYSPLTAETNI